MNKIDERRAFHRECPNCEQEALEVNVAGGSCWDEEIEQTFRWNDWEISCQHCKTDWLEHVIG